MFPFAAFLVLPFQRSEFEYRWAQESRRLKTHARQVIKAKVIALKHQARSYIVK